MSQWIKRSAAGFGALLFLVTSLSLTILVIWTLYKENKNSAFEKGLQDALKKSQQASENCGSATPPAGTLPAPEVYKPSGNIVSLQIQDLEEGSGAVTKNGDCIDVKYYGTLASDGSMFDNNFDKPTAFQFKLGNSTVIPGWDKGLVGMKVGGTRRLVVPPDLAYGAQGFDKIPPNATLVFVVKLERIN